jgi:anti-sigma regulatory factor (Ser/Thr protein kinase)/N-acetylglutamate synthase-like GNAT family acetyltransferase
MPKLRATLIVPNDTCYLPLIRAYVKAAAGQIGMDEVDVADVQLAVEEGCTHVIETAFAPGEAQEITVSCQQSAKGLQVTIADQGMPFDPASIPEYDARGGLDRDLRGLPFHLIQQAMDEVHFINKGWQGKELQLTKYLKVPSVEAYLNEEELRPYETTAAETTAELAPPGEIEYRVAEQNDALGIARCIYKTYRYTYPGENLYFPERIAAMNQSGEMISAVAVTEAGEVVGHSALSRQPGDAVMELGQAVVNPAYRGHGIANKLFDRLVAEARRRELAGLCVETVTVHPFSQRASHKFGFFESALLLARFPPDAQTKALAGQELVERETVFYGYLLLREEPCSIVYAPAHHRPMLERIYGNLGLKRAFAPFPGGAPRLSGSRAPTELPNFTLSTQVLSLLQIAIIEVTGYGLGILPEVNGRLSELCHKGIAVIYLHLPLGDPQTAVLCRYFEELGFIFAGVLPRPAEPAGQGEMPARDLLCLHYLNGPRVDYDRLQIYGDFGRELVEYIRAQGPLD